MNKLYFIIVSSTLLFFYSCKKEEPVITPNEEELPEIKWEKLNISDDQLVSAGICQNKLHLSFLNSYSIFKNADERNGYWSYIYGGASYLQKIPISNDLSGFFYSVNNTILHLSHQDPSAAYGWNLVDLGMPSDAKIQRDDLELSTFTKKSYFAINSESNQILVPFIEDGVPKLFLIQYTEENPFDELYSYNLTEGTTILTGISNAADNSTKQLRGITDVKGGFIAYYGAATFLIREDHSISEILNENVQDIYVQHDTIWASIYSGSDLRAQYSIDNGETWSASIDVLESDFINSYDRVIGTSIDNKVILYPSYSKGALYEMTYNGTQSIIKHIKLDGIPDNLGFIDVLLFQDNVYLATENGIYVKPLAHFFEYEL